MVMVVVVAEDRGRRSRSRSIPIGVQETSERSDGSLSSGCGRWDDQWWRERLRIGDTHKRFGHVPCMALASRSERGEKSRRGGEASVVEKPDSTW